MKVKHISIDFWGTLANSNPTFQQKRIDLISNTFDVDFDTAQQAFTTINDLCDLQAIEYGSIIDYRLIYTKLSIELDKNPITPMNIFFDEIQSLMLQYPPKYNKEVIYKLNCLQEKGITLSVCSNTNFISGLTIEYFIRSIGLYPDFSLYSDIIGLAKPHIHFYKNLIAMAIMHNNFNLIPQDIVHIGDDINTDGKVADHNIKFYLVDDIDQVENVLNNLN